MDGEKIFTTKRNVILFAIICTFLWGSAYPGVKTGLELFQIPTEDIFGKMAFAGYRFTLSGILVLLLNFILFRSVRLPSMDAIPRVISLGVLLTTVHYTFFYIGLSNTTGVNGSILNSTGTFFSVLLAHFIYKNDKISHSKIIGCIVGFAGVAIINISGGDGIRLDLNVLGDGFIVIAAFIDSVGFIYSKRLSRAIHPITLTGFQLLFGGSLLIIIAAVNGSTLQGFTLASTLLLIYLAFLTAGAFTLWTTLFKYNKVGKLSVFKFLVPVFGTILSAVFLKEALFTLSNISSLILVCAGIYLVNSPKSKWLDRFQR